MLIRPKLNELIMTHSLAPVLALVTEKVKGSPREGTSTV